MAIKSIRVEILNRQYPLRVDEESEALMRELAAYVDEKMTAFRDAYREQSEVTTAVITSLAIAEELYTERRDREQRLNLIDHELGSLAQMLAESLQESESGEA